MKIVDAQVHIWSSGMPNGHHRKVPVFTAEELLSEMHGAGVDAAIIHPPMSWDPDANEVAIDAARRYPDRFAVLGQVPLDRPESRYRLKGWRDHPGMMGLRYPLIRAEQQTWHIDGTMDWLWPEAEAEGLPVALMASRFLPEFKAIAESHPHLRLILDHCGLQRETLDAEAFANLPQLVEIARLANVELKATGAPGYTKAPYPFQPLQDGLHRLFDAFGPERFFWGTDITRMPCSYRQCVMFFTEELPWLKGKDLELVMGRAVCDWIGWKQPFVRL